VIGGPFTWDVSEERMGVGSMAKDLQGDETVIVRDDFAPRLY